MQQRKRRHVLFIWTAQIRQYAFAFKKITTTTTSTCLWLVIAFYDLCPAEPMSSHHGDRKEEKAPDKRANGGRGSGCLAVWADVIGGGIHSAISEVRRLAITHRLHHCVAFVDEFVSMCMCVCVCGFSIRSVTRLLSQRDVWHDQYRAVLTAVILESGFKLLFCNTKLGADLWAVLTCALFTHFIFLFLICLNCTRYSTTTTTTTKQLHCSYFCVIANNRINKK